MILFPNSKRTAILSIDREWWGEKRLLWSLFIGGGVGASRKLVTTAHYPNCGHLVEPFVGNPFLAPVDAIISVSTLIISTRFRSSPRIHLSSSVRSILVSILQASWDDLPRHLTRETKGGKVLFAMLEGGGELAHFADLNVQTVQTYGRDLYESIGGTKVAGINRGFSPTWEETDLSWSRNVASIRGWRDISFASEKKKERKEFSSTMNANGRNGILLAILR